MIIQNASTEGLTDFSFTVHRNEYRRAMDILEKKVKPAIKAKGVEGDDHIAKVSLVGIGMRTHAASPRACSRRWPKRASTSR
jgi:aspartate kinase